MPTTALVNIVILIALMIVVPFVWKDSYPVLPWVAIVILAIAAVIGVLVGAKWRKRGWDTDASRRNT